MRIKDRFKVSTTSWVTASLTLALAGALAATALAVGGAAFTTFNPNVDGDNTDVCKNSIINCNIYGAKEYVWLNGGPDANHLKPDGYYFFAVLEPGGQPNPNDQDGVPDKNLSDDFDDYTNRVFRTEGGEVAEYDGTHWLDSGDGTCHGNGPNGCGNPDDLPPFIRLFPYSDTTNPGGVYIMAICYIGEDGSAYPVEPRDCKYDAFKVKEGQVTYDFLLEGYKIHDLNADGYLTTGEPGLSGWTITIVGTGFLGEDIIASVQTGADGYWMYQSQEYTFQGQDKPQTAHLTVCEQLQDGWYQSAPIDNGGCYVFDIDPQGATLVTELNFGNYQKVDVTACKKQDKDGDGKGDVPVEGWKVYLSEDFDKDGELDDGEIIDGPRYTGSDGCFTWDGDDFNLDPGVVYNVEEGVSAGWFAQTDTVHFFDEAVSGQSYSFTFVNALLEGCTPGFWQGGPDKPDAKAGGALLWDGIDFVPPLDNPALPPPHVDQQWIESGGANPPGNPYIHDTDFNTFFGGGAPGDYTMFELVDTGGGSENWRKAARSLVAAYLNASWGMNYPYTTGELAAMWSAAIGDDLALLALHTELDAANNAYGRGEEYGERCPISAGGY
jgi:hypothetical protein